MRASLAGVTLPVFALLTSIIASTGAASAQGMAAMSLDMDSSGNTATSLGLREECVEVLPGETLTIDVTAESIPAETAMLAYSYTVVFDSPSIAITGQEPLMLKANPGSSLINITGPFPAFEGSLIVSVADIGEGQGALESGSGVLDRLTIEVATDAAPNAYVLSLQGAGHLDHENTPHSPEQTYDGRIAIGVSCASTTPIPPRTAAPTATPSPAETGGSAATPTTSVPGSETTPVSPTPATSDGGGTRTAGPGTTASSPVASVDGESDGGSSSATIVVVTVVAVALAAAAAAALLISRRRSGP